MHWTVQRTFQVFLENYLKSTDPIKVLEIGSANVNGGLRDFKRPNMEWVGVDLESGPGVDLVVTVGAALPFEDSKFDLVLASSVFEHDIQFWNTFLEMVRVLTPTGTLLLIMPSQGTFHRYPLDAFRFYPDSGIALEKWACSQNYNIKLVESFTTTPERDVWADFVAVYFGSERGVQEEFIGDLIGAENWILGSTLVQSTYQELPFELRKITELESANISLINELEVVHTELHLLLDSKSWRITGPLRILNRKWKRAKHYSLAILRRN
jgi:SAM-dependent methyltransferase